MGFNISVQMEYTIHTHSHTHTASVDRTALTHITWIAFSYIKYFFMNAVSLRLLRRKKNGNGRK